MSAQRDWRARAKDGLWMGLNPTHGTGRQELCPGIRARLRAR